MTTANAASDDDRAELRATAEKSKAVAVVLGLGLWPVAYYYVGRKKLAAINLLTLNYLMLGVFIVPVHVYKIVSDAESKLERRSTDSSDASATAD